MKAITSKASRIVVPVFTLCFLSLAMIWASYIRQRSFDKQDSITFAIKKNKNLAVALEQYAIRTLHYAEALSQLVRMEYVDKGQSLDLPKLMKGISMDQDFDECVSIIGSDGKLKMTNAIDPVQAIPDFSDKAYFKFHSQNDADSFLVTRPEISSIIGKQVIVASRRLYDKKGGFAGLITLEIQPSVFTSFYAQAQLSNNDIISLVTPDGITYARRTGAVESSGENLSKSPLFVHVKKHADSFYFAPDAIKHVPTWFSYRKMKNYPIIATVGSSEADILADFTKRQPRYIIPRIIMSILIILFSLLIAKFLFHRRKLSDQLSQEEEKYQRLLTEQMIAVQEREREWIGRELHDNVGQVLTTAKLYLEVASSKDGDNPLIPKSMQLINNSITEIRNLSHQLSAPTLGTRSLVDSINALIDTVAFSSNLKIKFDHTGYTNVCMSQQLALFRVLQEQLTNIVKHAQASTVLISLTRREGNLMLTVKDNGKGFDASAKTGGMGINNMISRAKVFDGIVHVEAAPDKGCMLTIIIPAAEDVEQCIT